MYRDTYAEIKLSHLDYNIKKLQVLAGDCFFCPMVKANAYGHGAVGVAKRLKSLGVQSVGVALLEEAIELREQSIDLNILHFGPIKENQVSLIAEHKITPVITSLEEIDFLKHLKEKIDIHLKIDIEMNRLGIKLCQIELALTKLKETSASLAGVCTHLAMGETLSDESSSSSQSLKKFKSLSDKHGWQNMDLHSLNSEGLMSLKDNTYSFGVRPGLAMYGVGEFAKKLGLKPVMNFVSEVALIKEVSKGEPVSYGKTWVADESKTIAIVSVGYADGYPWALSNKGFVKINEKKAKIIGRVCMDYIIVDITSVSVNIGDKVLLWGQLKNDEISLHDLADKAGTVAYELLTGISQRVPRKYINGLS